MLLKKIVCDKCNIPKWFVANCSSMLSLESMNVVAITPALLLKTEKTKLILLV